MALDPDLDVGIAAAGFGPATSASTIVHVARDLFDRSLYRDVTVGEIARAAEVNEVTVYRLFGSKDGLAAACWLGNIEKLRRGMTRDRRATAEPVERIRLHLTRLVRVAKKDAVITDAMLLAVQAQTIERGSKISPLDPRSLLPIPHLMEPLIAHAQKSGDVVDTYPSFDIAAFLSNALLLRVMTRKAESAADCARFVSDLLLAGIVTRSKPDL